MWYEISYELLYEDVYINFIEEAIKRSDTISMDIYWPEERFWFFSKAECLDIGMSEALYESRYKHEEKQFFKNKRIFEDNCVPFLQGLKKFLVGKSDFEDKLHKYNFAVTSDIVQYLLKPKSLSNWGFPKYPDNICFYISNQPWFVCTNHGQSNASIKISSKIDYDFWKALGVYFFESYHNEV